MPCAMSETISQTSLSCACPLPHTMYNAALVAHCLDEFHVRNLMLGKSIAMRCSHPNVRQAALDCDNCLKECRKAAQLSQSRQQAWQ